MSDIFEDLFKTLAARKKESPDISYTASLYAGGLKAINAKIEEEAGEVIEAAKQADKEHLIYEVGDLLFHLFVLCGFKEITLEDIRTELSRRSGISGHKEKRERGKGLKKNEDTR